MSSSETGRKLAEINDTGFFEQLATAVLREADKVYASLAHPGVNAEGRSVKARLDGITFELGAEPPHMIAVHHTSGGSDLGKKWLQDPAGVKARKVQRSIAPAGDVLKTAATVRKERKRTPSLRATFVLTTSQEPSEELVRDYMRRRALTASPLTFGHARASRIFSIITPTGNGYAASCSASNRNDSLPIC
jgi:hypothetical protein